MPYRGKFLLDASVFIEANRRYYSFDIAPSFWELLVSLGKNEKIISIDKIKVELDKGNKTDELKIWANTEFKDYFMSSDDVNVFSAYGEIIKFVQNQSQFRDYAKAEFADVADSWLIAYALAYDHTIVTQEEFVRDVQRRVPIPNVCKVFDIPYATTFDMLRYLKAEIELEL